MRRTGSTTYLKVARPTGVAINSGARVGIMRFSALPPCLRQEEVSILSKVGKAETVSLTDSRRKGRCQKSRRGKEVNCVASKLLGVKFYMVESLRVPKELAE